jgi:NAD+ synthase
MTALYQVSSTNNGIVVGTGNKIEDFGIGFFTKYGDGGVDISPIADLNKSEVFNMSKELGIINEILIAKPTDGLWEDNRNDEDQIGATYDELEKIMDYTGPLDNLNEREVEVYNIYHKLNKQNKHKITQIPIFKKNEIHTN